MSKSQTAREQAAVTSLVELLASAHASGDAVMVRRCASAIDTIIDTYGRTVEDTSSEQAKMPAVDLSALRTGVLDHYTLATFIADNAELAERNGITMPRCGDGMSQAVEAIRYWRSPEQRAIDAENSARWQREAAERRAQAAYEANRTATIAADSLTTEEASTAS